MQDMGSLKFGIIIDEAHSSQSGDTSAKMNAVLADKNEDEEDSEGENEPTLEDKINELINNQGIIRNKLKIEAAVKNAQAFIAIQDKFGSFDQYIWNFIDGKTIQNKFATLKEIPAETELSRIISKELKKKGFSFVGPTIIYSQMQATGMVNDHLISCYRYQELGGVL